MTVTFLCLAFFVDCTRVGLAVTLMCIYGIGFSAAVSGFYTCLLSLAPSFTGTISSVSMFFGIIGRLLAPDLVGFFRVYVRFCLKLLVLKFFEKMSSLKSFI